MNQQDYSGKACVSCAAINKSVEISQKLIDKLKEHELECKHASFEWTSSIGLTITVWINYYEQDGLRCETLKGVDVHDKLKYYHKESCTKEILTNVKIKNKKIFIGVEQGPGTKRHCVSNVS